VSEDIELNNTSDLLEASDENENIQQEKVKAKGNKVVIGIGATILAIAVAAACFWYFQIKVPYDQAVNYYNEALLGYDSAVLTLDEKNAELDTSIAALQAIIDSEEQPLDETLLTSAGAIIGEAQGVKDVAPEISNMPTEIGDISIAASEIEAAIVDISGLGDYHEVMASLNEAKSALETSIQQMRQLTNPSERFVIERIQGLPSITGTQAVTEDHDPNGHLNKQGGYTATVYFSSELIDQSVIDGDDIVDKGTDGGGAVEVYKTLEEAESRNSYLGSYDGGIFSSGSHHVYGTVIIRTSNELKASQQQTLEKSIYEALIRID